MAETTYTGSVTLEIEGMSCAGCVSRVERKLNRLEGVDGSVNLGTESARVRYDAERVRLEELLDAVEAAGYSAQPASRAREDAPRSPLRLIVAAALSVPLVALMLPALQFDGWEWLAFALGTPVVLWAGWSFHRAAALNARHGVATMDTLVSIGTRPPGGWSGGARGSGV